MLSILIKEINSFFSSAIGYLVIGIFLLLNGLFLWVFKGDFNILNSGFADLSPFFLLAPWILIFLISAITMRSFADEKKQGTLELLLTKPISTLQLVLGKYFGAFVLVVLALIPTLFYVYTIFQLGNPIGNLDIASVVGSYFGLLFLVASYTAIGVFSSSITDNQIVAFITAVFLCFFFYIGFESLGEFTSGSFLENLGMNAHFKSMSRGVIDTKDILYFVSIVVGFILITARINQTKSYNKKDWQNISILLIVLLVLNILTSKIGLYKRFDLTTDNRYTLSEPAKNIIKDVDSPITIDVFLEGDDFPSEFKRLKTETQQILEEFQVFNKHINFRFINPLEDMNSRERNIQSLSDRGLTPMQLSIRDNGKSSQEIIFPWALASYNQVTVKIPLLKNNIGTSQEENVNNSVQNLEYTFADGFSKLINPKRSKIAILKGNGELNDQYIADFLKTIKEYYYIAPFTLDSVAKNPQNTLKKLKEYDMVLAAKPTEAFSEKEKFVLDQFIMNGGKSLWLIDAVAIEKDSLYNELGKSYAIGRDLNLTDFFFKYGIRINPVLVNDLYSAPITLAFGAGSNTQYQPVKWQYSPLAKGSNNHPIVKNLNLVRFDFANQIDTIKNDITKTILLRSSPLSKLDGTPREISLEMIKTDPNTTLYKNGHQNLAILLEGKFTSVYNNRIKPFILSEEKKLSEKTKIIVISDGDVIKNGIGRNGPEELGYDKWTGQFYGNKEFLLNTVNYLLNDNGLINIRSKETTLAFLNKEKASKYNTKWQVLNLLLPLALLSLFGFVFNYLRRKKYAK